jgi:hypothetical protein
MDPLLVAAKPLGQALPWPHGLRNVLRRHKPVTARVFLVVALWPKPTYMGLERLVRAGASPTRSDPEGSSRNEPRLGRYQPLTQALLQSNSASPGSRFAETMRGDVLPKYSPTFRKVSPVGPRASPSLPPEGEFATYHVLATSAPLVPAQPLAPFCRPPGRALPLALQPLRFKRITSRHLTALKPAFKPARALL